MHIFYLATVFLYIYTTYLVGTYGQKGGTHYPILMIFGIFYPWAYDTTQLYVTGLDYFKDQWNWSDIIY